MIYIRNANLEDKSTISSVLAESWKSAYRGIVSDAYLDSLQKEHWVDFLTSGLKNNNIFTMIMINDSRIIGAAIFGTTKKENEAHLISFYLLPNKIGRGLGHTFYEYVETVLKNKGFSNCVLDVLEDNKKAIHFYRSHGFIDTGRETITTLGEDSYTCKVFEKALR